LNGRSDEAFQAPFSPDEKRIATASNDHTIKLWNAETGQELLTLEGHKDQVWSVAFSPDGQTLASGSWDRTARLWRAAIETGVTQRDKKTRPEDEPIVTQRQNNYKKSQHCELFRRRIPLNVLKRPETVASPGTNTDSLASGRRIRSTTNTVTIAKSQKGSYEI
jgi:WD40 repeat protein